ncbi:hypothetical protein Hypma_012096 [Hypsizygus marmoreus]|uniref:Uncharacterized protein n=1 Tax=Hypsizygus marmoreus TaxID=39966 RepID=A0A369JHP0_HYPMA|nr:hypothetical protein Hypma_012096 [Hypsizygus marmoreus]
MSREDEAVKVVVVVVEKKFVGNRCQSIDQNSQSAHEGVFALTTAHYCASPQVDDRTDRARIVDRNINKEQQLRRSELLNFISTMSFGCSWLVNTCLVNSTPVKLGHG